MGRITLESIRDQLHEINWEIVSQNYINLDTLMEFKCDEGHIFESTWKKMRSHPMCPICGANQFNVIENKLIAKPRDAYRVLGLDQATHTTGFAIFDDNKLTYYNTFETDKEKEDLRINDVVMWLISMVKNWSVDFVGIEGIQFQEQQGVTTFQALARLQGALIETCIQLQVPYIIIPTNTWRAHCGVKGVSRADKKKSMQMIVKQTYDVSVNNDIADAIGIGKYASDNRPAKYELTNWE